MGSKIKAKVTYENNHIEQFEIMADSTIEWSTPPGKMTVSNRRRFDRLIEELHVLMVDATVKKIELEEETT